MEMTPQKLYDPSGVSKEGEKIRKMYLNYISEDPMLCDCCDEEKPCVSMNTITGEAFIICEDCLKLILDQFGKNL